MHYSLQTQRFCVFCEFAVVVYLLSLSGVVKLENVKSCVYQPLFLAREECNHYNSICLIVRNCLAISEQFSEMVANWHNLAPSLLGA